MIAVYRKTGNSFYSQVSIYSDVLGVLVTRPGWSGNIAKESPFILIYLAFQLRDRVGQAIQQKKLLIKIGVRQLLVGCSDLVKGKIASPRQGLWSRIISKEFDQAGLWSRIIQIGNFDLAGLYHSGLCSRFYAGDLRNGKYTDYFAASVQDKNASGYDGSRYAHGLLYRMGFFIIALSVHLIISRLVF